MNEIIIILGGLIEKVRHYQASPPSELAPWVLVGIAAVLEKALCDLFLAKNNLTEAQRLLSTKED